MYRLSSEEAWENVTPDFAVTSSSSGILRFTHLGDLAPGGGGSGAGWPMPCEKSRVAATANNRTEQRSFKDGKPRRTIDREQENRGWGSRCAMIASCFRGARFSKRRCRRARRERTSATNGSLSVLGMPRLYHRKNNPETRFICCVMCDCMEWMRIREENER